MCVLYVFPPLQQDYRKIDVISKAEFDSQRDVEGDSDLVFGPLDQEDAPPAPAITTTTVSSKPETQAPQQRLPEREAAAGHRGRGHEMPSRGRGSVSPHSRQRRRKDKRARFYPVLNKQHNSPSDVSTRMYCVCVWAGPHLVSLSVYCVACSFLPSRRPSTALTHQWRAMWAGSCPVRTPCLHPLPPLGRPQLELLLGKSGKKKNFFSLLCSKPPAYHNLTLVPITFPLIITRMNYCVLSFVLYGCCFCLVLEVWSPLLLLLTPSPASSTPPTHCSRPMGSSSSSITSIDTTASKVGTRTSNMHVTCMWHASGYK